MADPATKHLFVLGYPDRDAAQAAVDELAELQRDQFLEVKDYAIVSKAHGGALTVTESKDADPGAQRGAVTGGLAAAFVALAATPETLEGVGGGGGGNLVVLASDSPIDVAAWQARLDEREVAWRAIEGADLDAWVGDSPVLTDDYAPVDQLLSPYPKAATAS